MKYMTTNEASKKWNISDRRIRVLCDEGRIDGAIKIGRNWSIPTDSVKPIDGRTKTNNRYEGLGQSFDLIDQLKKEIDHFRPLSPKMSESLQQNLIVEWTYNSNAIEGNTLTLSETKVVLEGITVGGKSVKEHLEAINHKEAILYLEMLVNGNESISEWSIKNIHQIILKDIDDSNAGKYRMENVLISGANHIPPKYYLVPELMQKLVMEYREEWKEFHPVVKATLLHGEFVKIHPFIDGNGRTSRLLLNFVLLQYGYPPIVIKKENRLEYYDALDHAHVSKDYSKFLSLVAQLVVTSEKLWLDLLK